MTSLVTIVGSVFTSWLIGFALLLLFCVTPRLNQTPNQVTNLETLVLNLLRNFSIFLLITYSLARLGIAFEFIILFELAMLIIMYVNYFYRNDAKSVVKALLSNGKALSTLSVVSVFIYLPPLLKTGLNGSIFGLSTIGNNDVAFYSLTSSEFLKTGFVDSGNLLNQNLNAAAFLQHQAANLIIAGTSKIFLLETWQTINAIMIFCISIAILGIAYLSMVFVPLARKKINYLVGFIVVSSPAITYIIGHVFLGQIMSIPIAALTLAIFIQLALSISHDNQLKSKSLVYLFALSTFVYPVFLLPVFFGSLSLYLLVKLVKHRKDFFVNCNRELFYIAIGFIVSLPYLPTAVHLLFLLNGIEAGWPIVSLTPASLIVSGKLIGAPLSNFFVLSLWIVAFCILCFILFRKSSNLKTEEILIRAILLFGLSSLYIFIVEARGGGYSYYQNWKLLFFFFPILYTLFLAELLSLARFKILVVPPLIIFSMISPAVQWLPTINNGVGVLTRDMSQLHYSKELEQYSALNVGLRPYFDSMVVADVIRNKNIYISAKTTMPTVQNPKACTLVDLRDGQYPEVEIINNTYGVIPSKETGCTIENPTDNFLRVKINEKLFFSPKSSATKALAENWSSVEEWGVWSLGTSAKIQFRVLEPYSDNLWIEIFGSPFLNTNLSQTTVIFHSPLFDSKTFIFKSGDSSKLNRIRLDRDELQKSNGQLDLYLETPNNVSPKSLGYSQDDRSLGFGLISIRITNVEDD